MVQLRKIDYVESMKISHAENITESFSQHTNKFFLFSENITKVVSFIYNMLNDANPRYKRN